MLEQPNINIVFYKELYDSLEESGEIEEIFPKYSGNWENDKEEFISSQENFEKSCLFIEDDSFATEDW